MHLIQHGHGKASELMDLVEPAHLEYCNTHGIQYWPARARLCPDRHPFWEKYALLRLLLPGIPNGARCGFLDADCVAHGENFLYALGSIANYGLTLYPDGNPNDGMFLFNNTPEVRAFFDKLWNYGPLRPPPRWPGECEECLNRLWSDVVKLGFRPLDARYNAFDGSSPELPIVVHAFHGKKHPEKLARMRAVLNR